MQVELPDQTVRDVQALLAKRGENGDVSQYIDRTLQRALFFDTVREVKRQNVAVEPEQLDSLIDEAIEAVRTESIQTTGSAADS